MQGIVRCGNKKGRSAPRISSLNPPLGVGVRVRVWNIISSDNCVFLSLISLHKSNSHTFLTVQKTKLSPLYLFFPEVSTELLQTVIAFVKNCHHAR